MNGREIRRPNPSKYLRLGRTGDHGAVASRRGLVLRLKGVRAMEWRRSRGRQATLLMYFMSIVTCSTAATLINTPAAPGPVTAPRQRPVRAAPPFLITEPPPPPPPTTAVDGKDDDDNDDGKDDGFFPLVVAAFMLAKRFPLAPAAVIISSVRPLRRAVRSWSTLVPMVVRLKLFELRRFETPEAKLQARDALDERLSSEFAGFIGSMRGAFVKVAQVLGSLSPPPVRKPYIKKLEPMADAAPGGRPWKSVQKQINRELRRGEGNKDRTLSSVFSEFDPVPIGTASVGQVHRAVLRSNGRTVAVKLQYPDARSLILNDLNTIHSLLKCVGKEEEASVVVRQHEMRIPVAPRNHSSSSTLPSCFEDEPADHIADCLLIPHSAPCVTEGVPEPHEHGVRLRRGGRHDECSCQLL